MSGGLRVWTGRSRLFRNRWQRPSSVAKARRNLREGILNASYVKTLATELSISVGSEGKTISDTKKTTENKRGHISPLLRIREMELWTETCAFLIDTCIFNRGDLHSFGPTKFLVSAKFAARLQSCTKHSILQQTGLLTPWSGEMSTTSSPSRCALLLGIEKIRN